MDDDSESLSVMNDLAAASLDNKVPSEASCSDTPISMPAGSGSIKEKSCRICGDRALGYNFNAVSCESCKAFFRRNAFKEIRGRCSGTCEVTTESRSYCKRCRLQKCFAVGMKRELIMNDQQKKLRCQKIKENRKRRGVTPASGSSGPVMSADSSDNASLSPDAQKTSISCSTAGHECKPGEQTHVIASTVDRSILQGLPNWCTERLEEVIHAFQISFDHTMEHQPIAAPSQVQFLNMADTSVRRLVKMARNLALFRTLDQRDQISLLKGAIVEVLVLRSSKMFNSDSMSWQVNKGGQDHQVSATSLNLASQDSQRFIQQYRLFVMTLLRVTHCDNMLLMLLIVMTVFSPDRVRPCSISVVAHIQEEYAAALREYITVRYPSEPLMLAHLLQHLCSIRDLNEKHTLMLLNMKLDELEPLIIEIFDLSAHF